MAKQPESFYILKREIITYREKPLEFFKKVLHFKPSWQQEEILKAVPENDKISIASGHGTGKTSLLAGLDLWFLSTHTDCKVPCTAPSGHQLYDNLWGEISKWHQQMGTIFRRELFVGTDRLFILDDPKLRFSVARTARKETPEALQGFHAKNLMFLIDEASGIPDTIFQVAEGSLSTKGAKQILAGNPTRAEGYFFDSHHKDRAEWKCFTLSSEESPFVTKNYCEKMAKKWGKESNIYKVRVLGQFPDFSDDTLIPMSDVTSAWARDIVPGGKKIAGLDVARFGDDATSLVMREGKKVIYVDQWRQKDLVETCGKVLYVFNMISKFDTIYVDSIGVGAGAVDILKGLHLPVVGVNVAEASPSSGEKFNRLRDELWWRSKEFFAEKQCSFSDTLPEELYDDLVGQLTAIKYSFTGTGKIKVEGKDEMKARGYPSPNIADALNLTLAEGLPLGKEMNFNAIGGSCVPVKTVPATVV